MSPGKFSAISEKRRNVDRPITILYIDQDYQISHWILREGNKTVSQVPLHQAVEMLKTRDFDLIFSEPQNLALLKPTPERPEFVEGEGRGH